jgi:hypothetical protein
MHAQSTAVRRLQHDQTAERQQPKENYGQKLVE